MKICQTCQSQVEDGYDYCNCCGSYVGERRSKSNIRCPRCNEEHALDANVVTVGKTTRTYWICRKCKNRFRDAADLEKELARTNPGVAAIVGAICGLLVGIAFMAVGGFFNDKYDQLDYWQKQESEILQTFGTLFVLIGAAYMVISFIHAFKKLQLWSQLKQEKMELQ